MFPPHAARVSLPKCIKCKVEVKVGKVIGQLYTCEACCKLKEPCVCCEENSKKLPKPYRWASGCADCQAHKAKHQQEWEASRKGPCLYCEYRVRGREATWHDGCPACSEYKEKWLAEKKKAAEELVSNPMCFTCKKVIEGNKLTQIGHSDTEGKRHGYACHSTSECYSELLKWELNQVNVLGKFAVCAHCNKQLDLTKDDIKLLHGKRFHADGGACEKAAFQLAFSYDVVGSV